VRPVVKQRTDEEEVDVIDEDIDDKKYDKKAHI